MSFILAVWVENAYSRPKLGFGAFDSLNEQTYQRKPKRV